MRKGLLFFALFISLSTLAQSREESDVLSSVRAVHQAIFVDKDSSSLERLFATEVTYGHSGGKLEDRATAIRAASQNKSTYTGVQMGPVNLMLNGKTAVTRYVLTGTETNAEGKVTELKLNILQVWVKNGNAWKMMARQAVKVS